jgi:16S rRNA (cytosine1402-N4)-methyltransferase
MLKEALEWLAPRPAGWWADLTVGAGGHTEALLKATAPGGRVLGIDRDSQALALARERLNTTSERLELVHSNYAELADILAARHIRFLSGILMDLGLSSMQVDDATRGFSFSASGPLDMRMDQRQALSAAELVNHASETELADLFYRLGEERRSRQLARAVVKQRPLTTTAQLAEIAKKAVGYAGRIHPATRAFQALRLAVNDELGSLERSLAAAAECLEDGGRLVVISFHSLEDRIVKQFLKRGGWVILTKHVVKPSDAEVQSNPRARSARLRAAQRLRREEAA